MATQRTSLSVAVKAPVTPAVPAVVSEAIVGPLFRRCDWRAALVAFLIAFVGYVITVAPNVTLEDSGEFITASHTLGVPHPPGYPIWAILTFLFDHLNPLSPFAPPEGANVTRRAFNIAWRVNLMSATFGAITAGLLALLISRSGSMLLRSVKTLNDTLTEAQEHAITAVSGIVGALIFTFSPVPWSQAVITEVYTLNEFFMVVTMILLFCWMRHLQNKYIYWTSFLWGLGLTDHQTLLFMAPAYFVLIALVDLEAMVDLIVAACFAAAAGIWFLEWLLDAGTVFYQSSYFWEAVAFAAAPLLIFLVAEYLRTSFGLKTRVNWKRAALIAACVLGGLAFYGYSPLSSMTNPPMNWGFTQDKDGFWHHLTRGQYEKMKIDRSLKVFWEQISFFGKDLREQYTGMIALLGLGAGMWFFDTDRRAKKWLIFTAAGFFFTSFTFIFLANPSLDRAVRFNDRVFFILTHAVFCCWIGYGLIWGLSYFTRHFSKVRWLLYGGAMTACLLQLSYQLVYHRGSATAAESEWYWVGLQLVILFVFATLLLLSNLKTVPLKPTLALVALLPGIGMLRNWADNEQQGHMFGWYFGYHMFEPGGGYPPMDKNAILYGGTDPGRFVPTYMIFCPRVHPDVYIITQNALAENTYLRYLRAQYSPSRKKDGFNWIEKLLQRDRTYPSDDIYISTDEDSAAAIRAYVEELQHRQALPGEQVTIVGGRVNIQGVQAVTALNGLISKQIFDKERDKHSFYVEESFVIAWMYPYLTPYGVIMKINHDPVPKITPEQVALNHQYWVDYAQKYLLSDPRFRRDDDAQRAFSKLRTAHAGLYAWRTTQAGQPELAGEAEFAFKQALELCPFNVEAVFRYAEFLTRLERYDDAMKIVTDYRKYDPQNAQIPQVLNQVNTLKQLAVQEVTLKQELKFNPGNLNAIMQLLSTLASRGKMGEMDAIIEQITQNKDLPQQHFKTIAQTYVQLNRWDRVETMLRRYLGFYPDDAQTWYDLGVVQVQMQKADVALDALERAFKLNPQFKQTALQDQRLQLIKLFPRFQQLTQ